MGRSRPLGSGLEADLQISRRKSDLPNACGGWGADFVVCSGHGWAAIRVKALGRSLRLHAEIRDIAFAVGVTKPSSSRS